MSLSIAQLMLDTRGYALIRVIGMSRVNQRVLFDDTRNGSHPHTFGERHKLHVDRDIVSRRVRLERQSEGIHDFSWPGVLNFQSLIKLECVGRKCTLKGEMLDRVKVRRKARSDDSCV